jgi:hypothetical protein
MEPAKEPITSTTKRDSRRCFRTALTGAVGSATKNSIAFGLWDKPRKTSMAALRSGRRSANVELRKISTVGPWRDAPKDNPAPIEAAKLILFYRQQPVFEIGTIKSSIALDVKREFERLAATEPHMPQRERVFAAQYPRPPMPLSTLQETPHDVPRKTRGPDRFATSFPG